MGIEIKFNLSSRERRTARAVMAASALLTTLGIGVALAGPPAAFQANDKLSASTMNAHFDYVLAQVASARVVQNGASHYSVGPTRFVKATAAQPSGNFSAGGKVGYEAAKAICEGAAGSPTAHMCTSEELVRSVSIGAAPPVEGWYSTGVMAYGYPPSSAELGDCAGWQNDTSASWGTTWAVGTVAQLNTNRPYSRICNESHPILCCD